MKNNNHIDEIFRNTFENFEADVDPSVWTNVQQNIGSGGNGTSSPSQSVSGSTGTGIAKSVLIKTAASILVTAGIAGSVYLISNSSTSEEVQPITEQNISTTVVKPETNENNGLEKENITVNDQVELNNISDQHSKEETIKYEETSTAKAENNTQTSINKKEITNEEITANNTVSNSVSTNNNSPVSPVNSDDKSTHSTENNQPKVADLNIRIKTNVKKGKAPLYVEFNTIGNATGYLWDFGDGNISSEETPFHTYKNPGTYKVSLTVIDKNANQKTLTQYIEVEEDNISSLEEVQNVFSPNGDGLNDVIKIEGKNIAEFHAVVMDSKGNNIFEWKNIDGFWDGKDNNNNLLPKGTYYIIVTAMGKDGKQHIKKKSIQLY